MVVLTSSYISLVHDLVVFGSVALPSISLSHDFGVSLVLVYPHYFAVCSGSGGAGCASDLRQSQLAQFQRHAPGKVYPKNPALA